ncbi:hypothetical protein C8J56DRAFT_798462 [Mycena floridula]|nr:hypothetical protein C8J56DRAFT_801349 [Mycena floridula]KAJ7577790.1 hypothetical protein C8J56DRAFT_798462 [Mycena floridula]
MLTNRSTRNTRIERLWVEVGTQFVRRWRAFFNRLERLHHLNVKKPHHLWLIHVLFLDQINDDASEFQEVWNSHPIAGEGHDRSPNDMQFLGQTRFGRYHDDCDNVHPDTIKKYYGVDGRVRRETGETGAGNANDERQEVEDISDRISKDQEPHIKHEAVKVPRHANPFLNSPQHEDTFFSALAEVIEKKVIPSGYGVLPGEWDEDGYPDIELLAVGRRNKPVVLSLAEPIWLARAEYWVQALSLLSHFESN